MDQSHVGLGDPLASTRNQCPSAPVGRSSYLFCRRATATRIVTEARGVLRRTLRRITWRFSTVTSASMGCQRPRPQLVSSIRVPF